MAVKLTEAMTVPLPEVEESGTISLDAFWAKSSEDLIKVTFVFFGPGFRIMMIFLNL